MSTPALRTWTDPVQLHPHVEAGALETRRQLLKSVMESKALVRG